MKNILIIGFCLLANVAFSHNKLNDSVPVSGQWSVEKINNWYNELPWLVGCNYYPATAINQIDMWQASTWDPQRIDLELSWAADMGMNTLRVYLHNLVWNDDETGLYKRMDEFLKICTKHNIRPWFVFFDDCHFPNPQLGEQPLPVAGYHNSGWLNCPGRDLALRYAEGTASVKEKNQLEGYVKNTIARFKDDKRVLLWELYNEPGRGDAEDGDFENKHIDGGIYDQSKQLVYDSWVWARAINPSQPITSTTAGSLGEINTKINRINSDLHSIHCYDGPEYMIREINNYKVDGRPIIMSEWLARDKNSTVYNCLPILKEMKVGAVNWGFVSGKSGTIWNWDSRFNKEGKQRSVKQERKAGNVVKDGEPFPEPKVWFHDLLRMDGTPYDKYEIEVFKRLTNKK